MTWLLKETTFANDNVAVAPLIAGASSLPVWREALGPAGRAFSLDDGDRAARISKEE